MQRSASSAPSHERTNAQIYDAYGQAIATLALRGQAPYQVSSRASRPESRALSSDGNSGVYPGALRLAPPLSVRPYSLSTGLFLRAYARAHRLAHPQFVSPSQALTLVRIHFGPEHPVTRRGARSIELPRKSSVLRVPTVLTESGSNFDDLGRSVSGRAGDVRRDSTGTSVVRPIAFGSLSTCRCSSGRVRLGAVSCGRVAPIGCFLYRRRSPLSRLRRLRRARTACCVSSGWSIRLQHVGASSFAMLRLVGGSPGRPMVTVIQFPLLRFLLSTRMPLLAGVVRGRLTTLI